jgi:hypothetical protein
MDATGIASGLAGLAFGGTAVRHIWRQLDADLQARHAARRRAEWAGWEHHSHCMRLRSGGECVGLPTKQPAVTAPPAPAPAPVAPAPVVEVAPDYVPDALVGQVIRDLVREREAS